MTVHGIDDAVRRAAAATRRLTLYHGIPRVHAERAELWGLVQSLEQPDSALSERCWELARELTWALWESGQPAELLQKYGLTADAIKEAVLRVLNRLA